MALMITVAAEITILKFLQLILEKEMLVINNINVNNSHLNKFIGEF